MSDTWEKVTEDQAKYILTYGKTTQADILIRCQELDYLIRDICKYPVETLIRLGEEDVADELERIEQESTQALSDIPKQIHALKIKYERINRMFVCLDALHPDEKNILNDLFIENKTWKEVSLSWTLTPSSSVVSRIRKKGLANITWLYNSNYSNSFIMSRTFDYFFKEKRKPAAPIVNIDEGHQMSIFDVDICLDLGEDNA